MSIENEDLVNDQEVESQQPEETHEEQENVVDSDEEAPTEVESHDSDGGNDESDIEAQSDWYETPEGRNNVIAGVKKKAAEKERQKTFEEAYKQALKDFSDPAYQQQVNNALSMQQQGNTPYGDDVNQQAMQQAPVNNQVQQQVANQEMLLKQRYIAAVGKNKYSDWEEKVGDAIARADLEAHRGDASLAGIIAEATNLPNSEDLIYKLASDPSVVNELKRLNPMFWKDELYKITQKPKSKPKVANNPVRELKAPPASSGGESSMDDLVSQAMKRAYGR